MPRRHRVPAFAIAALVLCACATVRPIPTGSVREIIPRVGAREVMLTDRTGRNIRLTAVKLVGDSVVGLSIDDAHRQAIAVDDIRNVQVFGADPVTSFGSSYGVFLIIIGAALVLSLIAHSTGR